MITGKLSGIARTLTTSAARMGHHGGVPGANLPFQIQNKYRLTLLFAVFFGSGFAIPFLAVRHHLTKQTAVRDLAKQIHALPTKVIVSEGGTWFLTLSKSLDQLVKTPKCNLTVHPHLKVMVVILRKATQNPDLTRSIVTSPGIISALVPALCGLILQHNLGMECLSLVLRVFKGGVSNHQVMVLNTLKKGLDAESEAMGHAIGSCWAEFPHTRGAGVKGVNLKATWAETCTLLLNSASHTLLSLLEEYPIPLVHCSLEDPHLKLEPIAKDVAEDFIRSSCLRLRNLLFAITCLLSQELPVAIDVDHGGMLALIQDVLHIQPSASWAAANPLRKVFAQLVPVIQGAALHLLSVLVLICGTQMLKSGHEVGSTLVQLLIWTRPDQESSTRRYSDRMVQLRLHSYEVLKIWFKALGGCALLETGLAEVLLREAIRDSTLEREAGIEDDRRKEEDLLASLKGLSKKKRKSALLEDTRTLTGSQERAAYESKASAQLAVSALTTLHAFLHSSGPQVLSPYLMQTLEEHMVTTCLELEVCSSGLLSPFEGWEARVGLYDLLMAICLCPVPGRPPPWAYVLRILQRGALDSHYQVSSRCREHLGVARTIVQRMGSQLDVGVPLSAAANPPQTRKRKAIDRTDIIEPTRLRPGSTDSGILHDTSATEIIVLDSSVTLDEDKPNREPPVVVEVTPVVQQEVVKDNPKPSSFGSDDPLLDSDCPSCGVAVQEEIIDLDSDPEISSLGAVDKKKVEERGQKLHMNNEIIVIDDSKNDIDQGEGEGARSLAEMMADFDPNPPPDEVVEVF